MYCSVQDLIDAFGEKELISLSNRDVPGSTVNVDVVNKAISQAQAEIDVYLEGRYPLPLASTPIILQQISQDLTRFFLHTRIDDDHPVSKRYNQRIRLLSEISKGKCSLGLDVENKVAMTADTVQIAPGRSVFGGRDW
ncbi:gp436 family protein [Undibacterium sp. Di27W]|uniref:gp436 family protein n=1 Tax=Undibacterium sp. Di27W TaxID=3413036 RepID=UPI003BF2B702